MFESDFCEHSVTKKKEGSYLFKIGAIVVLSLVFVLAFFFVVLPMVGFTVGILVFAGVCALLWYLSRYTQIEYEYSISGGYMDFASVYVNQYRKEKVSVDLKKDARKIAPFNGNFDGLSVNHVLDMRSSASTRASYYIVYEDDKVQKAVLFEATKKSVNTLFHQVPSIVTRSNELPEE
ncbi:MAG: hypothetical protein IJA60_01510 [Clostridia bacterium]|nr:hypothetical protein [Clostridia bacterium]